MARSLLIHGGTFRNWEKILSAQVVTLCGDNLNVQLIWLEFEFSFLMRRKPFHVLFFKESWCEIKCAAKSQSLDSGGLEL